MRADGRIEAPANSHDDADYRGKVRTTANRSWGAVTDITAHGGWMAGDPTVVGEANGTSTIHAGALW